MKKPLAKARKGKKGKTRAAPGKVDAQRARRRVAGPGKRARGRAVKRRAVEKLHAGRTHDALGRKVRSERERAEALRRRLPPLPPDGVPLHSRGIGPTAKWLREKKGISLGVMSDLTGISKKGLNKFEASDTGGNNQSTDLILRVLEISRQQFHRHVAQWEREQAGGGDKCQL